MGKPRWTTVCRATWHHIHQVAHWRRNCFSVPFCKAGKDFVSRLYLAYGSASALESVALKTTIVLPILLLQKPSKRSKTKHHIKCVERRMALWLQYDLEELTKEGMHMALQSRLPRDRSRSPKDSNLARSFANLMFKGKCKAALDLLSNEENGGILHLKDPTDPNDPTSQTVKESLINKHPQGQEAQPNCILEDEPQDQHPILFEPVP